MLQSCGPPGHVLGWQTACCATGNIKKVRLSEMAFVSRQGFYSKSLAAWREIHFFREFILVQVYEKCKYTNRTLKFPLSGYVPAMFECTQLENSVCV